MANSPLIALPEEINGPRVRIRPFRPADAPAVWQAIKESRAHLAPWLPWVDDYQRLADARDYLTRAQIVWQMRDDLPAGIFDRTTGRFLGGTGLHRVDWERSLFEIGYWLRRSALGHGFAREAAALLTRLAFTQLHASRVEIHCHPENLRSRRVAEALGFHLQAAPAVSAAATHGEPAQVVYTLYSEDFARLRWPDDLVMPQ